MTESRTSALLDRPWCAPALAAVAMLGARTLSYSDRLLDRDQAYWLTAAQRMADLDVPLYVAGWETKPPAVFLLYEAAATVAPQSPLLAVSVLGALVCAAAAAVIVATTARLAGPRAGLLAGVFFVLLDTARHVKHLAVGPETLASLPLALLAFVVLTPGRDWRRSAAALGALVSLAALCKQPALLYAPAGVVALIATAGIAGPRQWLVATAIGAATSIAVLAAAAGALALSGAGADAYLCLVELVGARAALASDVMGARTVAAVPGIVSANIPVMVGLVVFLLAPRRVPVLPHVQSRAQRVWVALAVLNLAGVTAALSGGMGFLHDYRQWYPMLAIIGSLGVYAVLPLRWRVRQWTIAALVLVACLAAVPDRRVQWRSRNWPSYGGEETLLAAATISESVPATERILIWGAEPELYVYAGRLPCTRMGVCLWLVGTFGVDGQSAPSSQRLTARAWELFLDDLTTDPPSLVVDASGRGAHGFVGFAMDAFPRLQTWVEANYEFDRAVAGYDFYRRKVR